MNGEKKKSMGYLIDWNSWRPFLIKLHQIPVEKRDYKKIDGVEKNSRRKLRRKIRVNLIYSNNWELQQLTIVVRAQNTETLCFIPNHFEVYLRNESKS